MITVHLKKIVRGRGGGRAGNKVIIDDVVGEIAAGIGNGVTGLIVVNDIINENVIYFGERIAVMRAGKNIVAPGEVIVQRFGVGAELLANRVAKNAVLHGNLIATGKIAVGINVVVGSELDGDVVENQIGAVAHIDAVFGRAGDTARADAKEANNFIGSHAEGNFVADEGDAARSRLPGNGEIVGTRHGAGQCDSAPDIEDDGAVGFANGVAERASTTIGKAGNMVNSAIAPSGGELTKALSTGEGGSLTERSAG